MAKPGTILQNQRFKKKFSRSTVEKAAQDLGSLGGNARAAMLSADQKYNIAVHAACARWGTPCYCNNCL